VGMSSPGVRTNSPRQKPDRPIKSVELKISVAADRETATRIKESFPAASYDRGMCRIEIRGRSPADVAKQVQLFRASAPRAARKPERL